MQMQDHCQLTLYASLGQAYLDAHVKCLHSLPSLKADCDGALYSAACTANTHVAIDYNAAHMQVKGHVCKDKLRNGGGRSSMFFTVCTSTLYGQACSMA